MMGGGTGGAAGGGGGGVKGGEPPPLSFLKKSFPFPCKDRLIMGIYLNVILSKNFQFVPDVN